MTIRLFNFDRTKKYVLIRKSFRSMDINGNIIRAAPNIDVNNREINYDRFEEDIEEFVRKFEYILTNVIDGIDLNLFYNHINSLVFEKDLSNDNGLIDYEGVYSLKSNKVIYQNLCPTVIGHELFHMASSIIDGDREYIGFMQVIVGGEMGIGIGLNEGYTQTLTERYVEKENYSRYPLSQFFVKKIEEIVGKEVMEKLYFKADLEGLIRVLEKYNTRDNILRFINILDVVTTYEKIYNSDMVDKKVIQYFFKLAFRDMCNFLFWTFMNKRSIESDRYSDKETNAFVSGLLGTFYYRDKEYNLLKVIDLISYKVRSKKINLK